MAHYQICLFGRVDHRLTRLQTLLEGLAEDLGLPSDALRYLDEANVGNRDKWLPSVAVFFGYKGATDAAHPGLVPLLAESAAVLTVVSDLEVAREEVPLLLENINALELADEAALTRLATLIFESFRLLRKERRVFISYKRLDSQGLADRLYDEFDKRGFDVFIDTRSVPPGVDFQDELWHRMSDCDVVLLIDTPNFRIGRWTKEELARANATTVQILHLLWPGQAEDASSALSEFFPLEAADFGGMILDKGRTIQAGALERICDAAERLRAKAIAARYRYLIDNFCDLARDKGLEPSVQPERWISLPLKDGSELAVVPAVGVPTSNKINEIFETIASMRSPSCKTWVIYDNRGLLQSWVRHLDWLDSHLPVRAIRVSSAADPLDELAS
jgi:hypothetical protein